jgi:fatty acid desaturase
MKGTALSSARSESYSAAIPWRLNIVLVGIIAALQCVQLFVLPLWLLPADGWWALVLFACVLSTTTNWSLIHEAIHRLLAPSTRANETYGRLLAILFGAPLEILRFAHLLHHQLNGTAADRPEHFETARTSRARAAIRYYPYLVFGIYGAEIAGTIASLMPRSALERMTCLFPAEHGADTRAAAYLLQPKRLLELRFDASAVILIYGFSFWCYGRFWPLLALSIVARGILVSVADNSYHYGAPMAAGAGSAHNLKFSFGSGILHFNLHRIHHAHPNLPWIRLPDAFHADGEQYDGGYVSALLRQFRGPVSDKDYARSSGSC